MREMLGLLLIELSFVLLFVRLSGATFTVVSGLSTAIIFS